MDGEYVRSDKPEWPGPTEAMTAALAEVQRDLDASALSRYQFIYTLDAWYGDGLSPSDLVITPTTEAAGAWGGAAINLEATSSNEILAAVGGAVATFLVEIEEIYWPICSRHGRRALATKDEGGHGRWLCHPAGAGVHELAHIGRLAERIGSLDLPSSAKTWRPFS